MTRHTHKLRGRRIPWKVNVVDNIFKLHRDIAQKLNRLLNHLVMFLLFLTNILPYREVKKMHNSIEFLPCENYSIGTCNNY